MALGKMARAAAVGLCAVLLASGCSLVKSGQSQPIDPPPDDQAPAPAVKSTPEGASAARTAPPADTVKPASETRVTAYFKDEKGFVVPLSVAIPKTDRVAQKALEYMVEDGPSKGRLPKGFTALLPKGTKASISLDAAQKLAVVDFSEEFAGYNPQDERKILEAVTWTLTGFPSVDKVRLKLAGGALTEMPVYNTPLDATLTRGIGINLELGEGVDPGRSTPVTLYFQNRTADRYTYFVPVTRMVKRTDQAAKAALEEMVKGPAANKGLATVLPPNTEVLRLEQTADKDLVQVDFNGKFLDKDKKASSDAMQAVILSLTENTGSSKVQVTVNGDAKFRTAGGEAVTQPAVKPAQINSVKS